MADEHEGGQATGSDTVEYFREEAKKAFKVRDEFKAKLRTLEESGRVLTDEQAEKYRALEAAAAKADEDRKRKAGEFDALKQQMAEQHQKDIAERDKKLHDVASRFRDTVVKAEFGAASSWFGGESAKTILDVDLGLAYLGKYVRVEDDDTDPRGYRVVVHGVDGAPMVNGSGVPVPFAEAIGKVIETLPNKDRILRGSGKTGSGSSGGSRPASSGLPVDMLRPMTAEELRDPKARAQMREQMAAAGGMQVGAGIPRR
jgi:hypothetical protein